MSTDPDKVQALRQLPGWPRLALAQLPPPLHPLPNLSREIGREIWVKRDDMTGLAGGGNKTRKLEFLMGDAVENGADMVATVGAIQSNHTRQTAAAAAKAGLKCSLIHYGWTQDAGEHYRKVGNFLFSSVMGADLYVDDRERSIEDDGPLDEFGEYLEAEGHKPYLIPGGGSDHRIGSLGYVACAAEIVSQMVSMQTHFDYVVHCTGSGGTQAGLIAGFKALDRTCGVIGIPDDYETDIKRKRVLRLSNATLASLNVPICIQPEEVEIVAGDVSPYGIADQETFRAIELLARTEGLMADPVYEGKAVRGLIDLLRNSRFAKNSRILLLHLGGTPAVHAYANQFPPIHLRQSPV